MIAVIGRPVKLVVTVSFMHGVLCTISAGIDECKRLAHEIAVHLDDNTIALANHANRIFTVMSVDKNVPAASGVYGLSDARQWIYVGETANIHAELLKHLRHPNAFLRGHRASGPPETG